MSGLGVFMVRTRWSTFCMETVNKRKKGGLALFKVKKRWGRKQNILSRLLIYLS